MIGPGTGVRVYLACGITDMRKGIEGLAALTVERQPPWPAHCLARIIPDDPIIASLEMFPEQFVLGVGHEADQHGHER